MSFRRGRGQLGEERKFQPNDLADCARRRLQITPERCVDHMRTRCYVLVIDEDTVTSNLAGVTRTKPDNSGT
jgi:hypothetical protein